MCGFCFAASIACCVMVVAALYHCSRERRDLLRALLEGRVDQDTLLPRLRKRRRRKRLRSGGMAGSEYSGDSAKARHDEVGTLVCGADCIGRSSGRGSRERAAGRGYRREEAVLR